MTPERTPAPTPPPAPLHNVDLPSCGDVSWTCTLQRTEASRPAAITSDNKLCFDIGGNSQLGKVFTCTSDNSGDEATLEYVQGSNCVTLVACVGTWVLM